MHNIRLALVGFGNVAQGLTQILAENGDLYADRFGVRFSIVAVADPVKGNLSAPDGAPLRELLAAGRLPGGLNTLPGDHPAWSALEMIQQVQEDALVELSFTNLKTGEPATSYLSEALRHGMNVVTTNKGPIALHYDELEALARSRNLQMGVEGTVMSGTPCLRLGRQILAGAGIRSIQGILNGTTNYILTQMESGKSYATALAEAQAQGYAEADPTGDVEGFDAAAKVAILTRLIFGQNLALDAIERVGITGITQEMVAAALAKGSHWKLVGSLEWDGQKVVGRVKPECLLASHSLATIAGATNAIRFSTALLDDVTLIGPGAGRLQTGYAVVQDLLAMYQS